MKATVPEGLSNGQPHAPHQVHRDEDGRRGENANIEAKFRVAEQAPRLALAQEEVIQPKVYAGKHHEGDNNALNDGTVIGADAQGIEAEAPGRHGAQGNY
ncbi:hypothetical protein ES703_79421 [subsurface metagenome]